MNEMPAVGKYIPISYKEISSNKYKTVIMRHYENVLDNSVKQSEC